MSSSSDDSQSPPRTKPEPPPKVRGLFGKQSIPPPPAGRGPIHAPKAELLVSAESRPELPTPSVIGAPDLPASVDTMDDPLGDLFGDGAKAQASEASWSVHDEPTRSVPREELMLTPSVEDPLFDDVGDARTSIPPDHAPVAKLGLAKTMLAGVAHEVMASEPLRDPRAEPNTMARESQSAQRDLVGVVFDPDQSVARHLGEAAIDGAMGSNAPSDALRDLPLPQVPSVPAPLAPVDELPVRSMRSAMIVISLVLISGGAATLVSLGVIGGSPAKLRERVATSAPTPPAAAEPATVATRAPTPAPAETKPTPVVAEPKPTLAAPQEPTPAATAPQVEAKPPAPAEVTADPIEPARLAAAPVPSGDPIAAGDALLRAGDLDSATAQYQAALSVDARDHHAMEGLARVHLARGQAAEALAFADQIVKRRPKRAAYRVLQGQARSAVGDRAGAKQAFQEALALEPDNRDAQRLLGP